MSRHNVTLRAKNYVTTGGRENHASPATLTAFWSGAGFGLPLTHSLDKEGQKNTYGVTLDPKERVALTEFLVGVCNAVELTEVLKAVATRMPEAVEWHTRNAVRHSRLRASRAK